MLPFVTHVDLDALEAGPDGHRRVRVPLERCVRIHEPR